MALEKSLSDKYPIGLLISKRAVYASLFVFFLLSIYTEVPLYLTDTFFIPSFLTVFSIPVLVAACRKKLFKSDMYFIFQVMGVLVLTAVLSPGRGFMMEKFIGVVQTTVSITAGVLLLKLMGHMDTKIIRQILLMLVAALVVGTVLEVSGVLKGASDAFREAVYIGDGYKAYSNDARDMMLTGFLRPKLFTSEPSLLAIGFFAFANSWLLLSFNRWNFLAVFSATVVMLLTTGSPIIFISLLISFFLILLNIRRPINRVIIVTAVTVLIALVSVVLYLTTEFGMLLTERLLSSLEHTTTYAITSENLRIVFPYLTLVDILRASPVFGTGISGKEVIEAYSTLPLDPRYAFGNNNFAALFIYLGLVGSALFLLVFGAYLRRRGIQNVLFLAVVVVGFSQGMGAFESPRFWGYVFLFIGVMQKFSYERPIRSVRRRFRFVYKAPLREGES